MKDTPEVITFACRMMDTRPSLAETVSALLDREGENEEEFFGRLLTAGTRQWLNGEGYMRPGTLIRRLAREASCPVLGLTVRLNRKALRQALKTQDSDEELPENVGSVVWTLTEPSGAVQDVTEKHSLGPVEWYLHGDLEETAAEMLAIQLGDDAWDKSVPIHGWLKAEFDAPSALVSLCEAVISAGSFRIKELGATRLLVVQAATGKRMQAVSLEDIERVSKATGIQPT